MLVIAFLLGLWLVRIRAPRFRIDSYKLGDALIVALFLGVIGARVVFILQELPYYLHHVDELFSWQFSGLTSFGGLLFGLVWMIIWSKMRKISAYKVMDCIAPSFLLCTAVGRIGCLLNGCCYGGVCAATFPLAIFIPQDGKFHYPAEVIDFSLNLIGMFFLLALEKRKTLISGQAAGIALMLNGLSRFIFEFWRGGTAAQVANGTASSEYLVGRITEAQFAAAGLIIIGIALYYYVKKKSPYEKEWLLPITESSSEPVRV